MHGFYDEGNLTELYTRVLQFLGTNIGLATQGAAGIGTNAGTPPTQHTDAARQA